MDQLGYRTFGIGKFHTIPHDEDIGYDIYLQAGEMGGPDDAFVKFIAQQHPAYAHIEQLHGERTNMYYAPQLSPLPAELTMEAWAADRAVEQMSLADERPFFGFVSFIGPHPPCAPPVPYNRMYDPDRMPDPILGDPAIDLMDERVVWNNYFIYAEDISAAQVRNLRTRYYGEVSFIDACIGRILDAIEARPDGDDTLICFFSDHGDYLGDHRAWQKENFYEQSCHVPFLISWPGRIAGNARRDDLVSLTDLFGLATGAAGRPEPRDGIDLLGLLDGSARGREYLFGFTSAPGDLNFRLMVRKGDWKYNYMANGGREQLFNLADDPHEVVQRLDESPHVARELRQAAIEALDNPSGRRALAGGDLRRFPATKLALERCKQFNSFRGVTDFPENPGDALE
jgi:choline-sulfatase